MVPRERLQIAIRTDLPSNEQLDDTFMMGVPKALHSQDVPTKAESILHLEELARKYAEWLNAHEQKKKETGAWQTFKFVKQEDSKAGEDREMEDEEEEEEADADAGADADADADGSEEGNDTTQVRRRHPLPSIASS